MGHAIAVSKRDRRLGNHETRHQLAPPAVVGQLEELIGGDQWTWQPHDNKECTPYQGDDATCDNRLGCGNET